MHQSTTSKALSTFTFEFTLHFAMKLFLCSQNSFLPNFLERELILMVINILTRFNLLNPLPFQLYLLTLLLSVRDRIPAAHTESWLGTQVLRRDSQQMLQAFSSP